MKTRANSGGPVPRSRSLGGEGGFTLVEVLIAMAIVGLTAVVLLDQRIGIVQDAGRARDKRTSWVLAAQKMAELELDPTLWIGLGGQNNGDFSEVDPEYSVFSWEYAIVRQLIDTAAPLDAKQDDPKKRELFRLTLTVRAAGVDDPILLEAEFPVNPPKPETPDAGKPDPKDGKPPEGGEKK